MMVLFRVRFEDWVESQLIKFPVSFEKILRNEPTASKRKEDQDAAKDQQGGRVSAEKELLGEGDDSADKDDEKEEEAEESQIK